MIRGVVNLDFKPMIPIRIHDLKNESHTVEAVVVTGFTGWLTLPHDKISELQLSWHEWGAAILADGSRISYFIYDALVEWDDQMITIPVAEMEAIPLAGMRLMQGFRILIDDIDGGLVKIARITN